MTTRFASKQDTSPLLVIALQEVNGPMLKIMGYDGYAPSEDLAAPTRTALYTHTSKVWAILRSLLGQRKTYNGAARVALREGISAQELAEQAAQVFFPQTSHPTDTTYQKDANSEDSELLNSPFTMLELEHALQNANARSTPGADGVISNRTRGVNEREMRQLAQAFLVSRIMYGLPYHPVNRMQMLALERLLNDAKRIVTGRPRYTRLDALKSCNKLNNLSELVDVHIQAQETRLRATNAGRYTFMLLGYDIHKLPILLTKTSPWEITVLTDGKPLPRNMDPTQRVRRLTYAERHAKATSSLPLSERVIYTDAALPTDGTSNTRYVTAWYARQMDIRTGTIMYQRKRCTAPETS
ncbi:hypothetical protein HPB50_009811 [Hyalomma asiaticum]|uniref:Uncharacterized protein n=1 Tax=Hyalomma asiaticum TaxID=266040 RepID=A0ACB7T6Q0_HYAAI|nr:hypothetical protein HPB50_009811 [Hyalomma asiaticum]